MKNRLIYSLSFLAIFILIFACRKNDNPILPELTRVPLPLITKVSGANAAIDFLNINSFAGKFAVDTYFKSDVPPKKIDLVIMKNGDVSSVKAFKTNVTTFPSTFDIKTADLQSLFVTLALGDYFDVGANITTQDGTFYEAFPSTGAAYGTGIDNQPGASTTVRYQIICVFVASNFGGNFKVLVDDWNDYSVGQVIPVSVVNSNTLSFEYNAYDPQPILMVVDASNAVTVARQIYGNYGDRYGNYFCASVAGNDSYVDPCNGIISVKLNHSVAAGTFPGSYIIKLQKQ